MSGEPVTSNMKWMSLLFDLEAALLNTSYTPLKSHFDVQLLLQELDTHLDQYSVVKPYIKQLVNALKESLELGVFLSEAQWRCLMAWSTELRSLYVVEQHFSETLDCALLEAITQSLVTINQQSQSIPVSSYLGEFSGSVPLGFSDFSILSDLGYWVIDHAENQSSETPQKADVVCIRVVLETGLTLEQLQGRLSNWRWCAIENPDHQVLSLPQRSRNYWVDWLHLMASEREVWRRSASFLRFYKSLQEQVREQFSEPLDGLLSLPYTTNLRVMESTDLPREKVEDVDLYGGRLFLLDETRNVTQTLFLSESVVPVYCLRFEEETVVVPVYRVSSVVDSADVPEGAIGWQYVNGQWCEAGTGVQTEALLVRLAKSSIYVFPESYQRDYGVVLRASYLPTQLRNVWTVRGEFYKEPLFPDEVMSALNLAQRGAVTKRSRQKNHVPVYFELGARHGIELYSDMVVGLQAYQGIDRFNQYLIYYSGHIVPLIEPAESACKEDDMVIIVEVKGAFLAFRGRYSKAKNVVHKLVEGTAILLALEADRIQINIKEEGWFLLDQRHMFLFHQQLLEIFN